MTKPKTTSFKKAYCTPRLSVLGSVAGLAATIPELDQQSESDPCFTSPSLQDTATVDSLRVLH